VDRYTYTGDQTLIYSFYRDVTDPEHPVTLRAEPGQTYDIAQTTGHQVLTPDGQFTDQELPMPPDDAWTPAEPPKAAAKKKEQQADG
jgi:hypothetical protein